MSWFFSPAGAAAIPHARATAKTVEGGLSLGSLRIATAAAAAGLDSQFFFLHDVDQFLVHRDDLLRKAAVSC